MTAYITHDMSNRQAAALQDHRMADRAVARGHNAERITTHREGGWIATGVCGRPHLVGRGWSWWRCPVCTGDRRRSTAAITARQARTLALYYPGRR